MATPHEFEKEKMICGIIYRDKEILGEALKLLTDEFGPIDFECEEFSFSKEYSSYYDEELGGEGTRRICSFERLVDPALQAEIKEFTNALEAKFSRKINLDPGFMSHGRLMLATTKPTGFRVPLKRGIYTEITLFYSRGEWHKLPWTYRDYQSEKVQNFLKRVRNRYLKQRTPENPKKEK